jgi:hypothetical protein
MAKRSAPANWVASKPDHARCRQAKTPGPTNWGRCCAVSNCAARLNLRSSAAALKTLLNASSTMPDPQKTCSRGTKDLGHFGRKYVQGAGAPGMESSALVRAL